MPQLPEELLWKIAGHLDVRSLCTARIVCKELHRCASGFLKVLQINSRDLQQPPSNMFTHLSGLTRVAVSVKDEYQLHLLAQDGIAPVITHVDLDRNPYWDAPIHLSAGQPDRWIPPHSLGHLLRLPKLRCLSLEANLSEVELLPDSLEELYVTNDVWYDVSPFTRLSCLVSLGITMPLDAYVHSFTNLTCLLSLRSLEVSCGLGQLGALSAFTGLTSLTVKARCTASLGTSIFRELVHLTGLLHLGVPFSLPAFNLPSMRDADLVCLGHLTKLTSLRLESVFPDDWVTGLFALIPLTGLVSLGLNCGQQASVVMSLLSIMNVEAFHSLALLNAGGDISFLQRATQLTGLHLDFGWRTCHSCYQPTLERAVARMSSLRSLKLEAHWSPKVFRLRRVLQLSTSLTYLCCTGDFTVGSDIKACASLPNLRCLILSEAAGVTPTCLPGLQALSGLHELSLLGTGIHSEDITSEVRAAFDAERLRRGWPPLKLQCTLL